MKTSFLIFLSALLLRYPQNKEIVREYNGGRPYFSGKGLILYNDSTYSYYSWSHSFTSIKDSGIWISVDSFLIFNSFGSEFSQRKWLTKKERKKMNTQKDYFYQKDTFTLFRNDSFITRNKKLFLFHFKDLKDENDSSFNFTYNVLYEASK